MHFCDILFQVEVLKKMPSTCSVRLLMLLVYALRFNAGSDLEADLFVSNTISSCMIWWTHHEVEKITRRWVMCRLPQNIIRGYTFDCFFVDNCCKIRNQYYCIIFTYSIYQNTFDIIIDMCGYTLDFVWLTTVGKIRN